MEINKIKTKELKKVVNKEGSLVLQRNPEIQLYLEASNLNLKKDKFYESSNEKLKNFIEQAKNTDEEFLLGLAKFLADNGLKLSPVVLLSILSNKGYSFKGKKLNYIFNTPQRIAEAVALNKTIKLNNSFKKNILKEALESFNDYTLTKNQLKNRAVKTSDLIKLLRPKPRNEDYAKLYKEIIEGTAKFKENSFVRVKSNTELTKKDKIDYLKENVDKIPLNELIRNLKFISDNANFKDDSKLQKKVMERLESIKDYRFLNIFDLIETCIHVPKLEKMLFEVVLRFSKEVKKQFDFPENATFLFDASGSMDGEGVSKGFKYLVLLSILIKNPELRFFGNGLWDKSKSEGIMELIKEGKLNEAFKRFETPDGTALIESTKELLEEDTKLQNLIVISDEVSWIEGEDLTYEINSLAKLLSDKKVVLINPVVYSGTVFKDNIMAFSSLTSAIIYNVSLHINPNKFIETIREYGK